MPYKVKGKCVYKKDTGKKVGCTKGSVKKYLAALHANVKDLNENWPYDNRDEEYDSPEYKRIIYKGYKIEIEKVKEEDKSYWDLWVTTPEGKIISNPKNKFGDFYNVDDVKTYIDKKTSSQFKEHLTSFEDFYENVILEDVDLKSSGSKGVMVKNEETGKVERVDLTDFIFANTNGGTEPFTVVTIRANDSDTDPSKKAGDEMTVNGKIKYKYTPTGIPSPLGSAQERYKNYDILTLLVSSVDGKSYPPKSIRNIKVDKIKKLIMGRETYNILR
jgi:hypothetical protein